MDNQEAAEHGFPGGASAPPYGTNTPASPPPPVDPPRVGQPEPPRRRISIRLLVAVVVAVAVTVGAVMIVLRRDSGPDQSDVAAGITTTTEQKDDSAPEYLSCDEAVRAIDDPLSGPTPLAASKVPAAGEGIIGDLLWAAPVPQLAEAWGIYGDTFIVADNLTNEKPMVVSGRDVETGAKKWAFEVKKGLGAVNSRWAVGETMLYAPASPEQGVHKVAAVDLLQGKITGCFDLRKETFAIVPTNQGFLANELDAVTYYPDGSATWTAAGNYEILGVGDSVMFAVQDMRSGAPNLVGVDMENGIVKWSVSLADLTVDAVNVDGSTPPEPFSAEAGVANWYATDRLQPYGPVVDDVVSFSVIPTDAASGSGPMWIFQVSGDGSKVFAGHMLAGSGRLLPGDNGNVWVPKTTDENETRPGFTLVGPNTVETVIGPQQKHDLEGVTGLGLLVTYGPIDPADPFNGWTLMFSDRSLVGKINKLSSHAYKSLAPGVWADLSVYPEPVVFAYRLKGEGGSGSEGEGTGGGVTPVPVPTPTQDTTPDTTPPPPPSTTTPNRGV